MYTNIDMQIFKMASEPCVIAYRVGNHWVLKAIKYRNKKRKIRFLIKPKVSLEGSRGVARHVP